MLKLPLSYLSLELSIRPADKDEMWAEKSYFGMILYESRQL